MYRRPDTPSVKTSDSFEVYWSICNRGDRPSVAETGAYSIVATETQTNAEDPVTLDLPAIAPCVCVIGTHNFQNELTPGTYRFELTGQFSGTPAVNEILTAP
jgi:hypothetical protein